MRVRLILIHGTWPKGLFRRNSSKSKRKNCYDPGSPFHDRLVNELSAAQLEFETSLFLWNGRNSVLDRNTATVALAKQLERMVQEEPNSLVVIVAHSHGGNIALRAVHVAGPDVTKNVKVATLATVFVQIHAHGSYLNRDNLDAALVTRSVRLARRSIANLVFAVALGPVVTAVGYLNVYAGFGASLLAFLTALVITAVIGPTLSKRIVKFIVNPLPRYTKDWGRADRSPNGWQYKPERLVNLSFYPAPVGTSDWLLVLRGVDDEASLILAAALFGKRMIHFIIERIIPRSSQFLTIIGLLTLVASKAAAPIFEVGPAISLDAVQLAGIVMSIVSTITLLLPGCFSALFGYELLFECWRCEIAANSAPDISGGVKVKTLLTSSATERETRHSLYLHPAAPLCVVEWIGKGSTFGTDEL